jgi:hypothetical protein
VRDQNYEVLLCIGISPFDAHVWIMNKRDISFNKLQHQHGGVRGKDTWWIQVDPKNPPEWMKSYSGKLSSIKSFFGL